jgi:hypothetical protein
MKTYTTPHSQIMLKGKQPRNRLSLDALERWARRLGHYPVFEAIERYRRIK